MGAGEVLQKRRGGEILRPAGLQQCRKLEAAVFGAWDRAAWASLAWSGGASAACVRHVGTRAPRCSSSSGSSDPLAPLLTPPATIRSSPQVSGSTAAMLAVGRFAFLPFQRRTQAKSQEVGPKTTGAQRSVTMGGGGARRMGSTFRARG